MQFIVHPANSFPLKVVWATALCLCGACLVWAAAVICPKCGHEHLGPSNRCGHCRAVLSGAAEPEAESAGGAMPLAAGDGLAGPWVEQELELAIEAVRDGDLEVARLFLKNASALEQLSDPAMSSDRGVRILRLQEQCEARSGTVRVACPGCEGTGKEALQLQSLNGRVQSRSGQSRPCRHCAGKGHTVRRGTIDEARLARGQAQQRYRDLQLSRRYRPVGGAWVPPSLEKALSVTQTVTLKRAAATACRDCSGLGRADCGACRGRGRIKCSNRDCLNGIVTSERKEHFGKGKHTWRSKCGECEGRGWTECEECGGKGNLLCEECAGIGERPPCKRCTGKGLQPCRRCRGAGDYKDSVCTYCGGAGVAACTTCSGDGRSR